MFVRETDRQASSPLVYLPSWCDRCQSCVGPSGNVVVVVSGHVCQAAAWRWHQRICRMVQGALLQAGITRLLSETTVYRPQEEITHFISSHKLMEWSDYLTAWKWKQQYFYAQWILIWETGINIGFANICCAMIPLRLWAAEGLTRRRARANDCL